MDIVNEALKKGQGTLSEYEAKKLLRSYEIPVAKEELVKDKEAALKAARVIGYPVVLKVCSLEVTYKTERGFIEFDLRDKDDLIQAFQRLQDRIGDSEGDFLIQEMVKGERELVIGMVRDPQFGACVMFGLGGIFTEILKDVSFRVAPIEKKDALEMMCEIKTRKILEPIRGMEAVDLEVLSQCLIALGRLGLEQLAIQEVDVNPMIIRRSQPVAVDALVVLKEPERRSRV